MPNNRHNYFVGLDEHPWHPVRADGTDNRCPLCVRCSFCNAAPDRPCMTSFGSYLSENTRAHLVRVDAAYKER